MRLFYKGIPIVSAWVLLLSLGCLVENVVFTRRLL